MVSVIKIKTAIIFRTLEYLLHQVYLQKQTKSLHAAEIKKQLEATLRNVGVAKRETLGLGLLLNQRTFCMQTPK